MVYLYAGTPGSGKSFHLAARIFNLLFHNSANVIANFPIDVERVYLTRLGRFKLWLQEKTENKIKFDHLNYMPVKGHFMYLDNSEITIEHLKDICHKHHKYKVAMINGEEQRFYYEDQTLLIIDESQLLFNCRDFGDKSRKQWCEFFTQHRKYGYNIILVAIYDRMLDRQIRSLIEVSVQHRNCKYWKTSARILSFLCGGSLFVYLYQWQGCKEIMKKEMSRYSPRISGIYNSYRIFKTQT